MKITFKINAFGIFTFAVLCGLFYWLCPLPSNGVLRALVCIGAGILFGGMCFVVVTHRAPSIRK